ncbi:MAG: outer membrane beta-barrel family protein [Prevotella sp.]
MNKLALTIVLLMPIYTFARTLCGNVTDEENNPIAFANVLALDRDSSFLEGVVTDSLGRFHFDILPKTSEIIKVSCIGYDDYIIAINKENDLGVIRMKVSSAMLNEVVVKGNLPKTRIIGNALVTTVSNSILADAGNANDVLTKVPLVTGSEGKFSVFGAGTPIIYINGRVIHNIVELEQLSSKEIKSVEVITNPDVKYFAETNAVIKIKTIPPKGEGFSISLYNSARIAHFATNTDELLIKYRHGGLEIFAQGYFHGGKRRTHELSSMTTYGHEVFVQELENLTTNTSTNSSGKIGFNFQQGEKHSFGAYYKAARYKDKSRGLLDTEIKTDGLLYQKLHQYQSGIELIEPSNEANIYYNGSIKKLSIDFNGDYIQTYKSSYDIQNELNGRDDDRIVCTSSTNKNRLLAEKLMIAYPLWNGTIEVGEEYTNSHVNYHSYYTGVDITGGDTKIKESNIAAFVQFFQQFGPCRVGLGIRFEHVSNIYSSNGQNDPDLSRTYNNWFPSFSLSCKMKKVGLSFNLTSHTRRPSYRQLDGTLQYVNRYSYRIGNPALSPVERYATQLMAQWNVFFAQVAYHYEKNSIFYAIERYKEDPLIKLIVFENIPKYHQLQFVIGAQPTIGWWSPQITVGLYNSFYTTQFIDQKEKLNRPFFFANWDNSISLSNNWLIDVDYMFQTAGNGQNCYIKATSYLNIGVRKSFFNNTLTLQLKANDIFNVNNERIIMYNGDIKVASDNYHESRNLVLSLRYNFNTSRSKYRGKGAGLNEKKRL